MDTLDKPWRTLPFDYLHSWDSENTRQVLQAWMNHWWTTEGDGKEINSTAKYVFEEVVRDTLYSLDGNISETEKILAKGLGNMEKKLNHMNEQPWKSYKWAIAEEDDLQEYMFKWYKYWCKVHDQEVAQSTPEFFENAAQILFDRLGDAVNFPNQVHLAMQELNAEDILKLQDVDEE